MADPPIYTNPASPKAAPELGPYDTKLSAKDETAYQAWLGTMAEKNGHSIESDDYDMRGFYKKGGKQAGNGHFTDEFKKPNHPSFSTDSKYSGKDGNEGGSWEQTGDKWTFTPGKTNIANGLDKTREYFQNNDPDVTLVEPEAAPVGSE